LAEAPQHCEALVAHQSQLAAWAARCPANFADRATLVAAEIARVAGRELEAERLYEEAIALAREHGFIQNEGLGNERAARFHAARGFETIAHAYLRNARSCYRRWGAEGKVRQLDQSHPHLREESALLHATTTIGAPVAHLDVDTVVKASQAVSSEIVLPRLIETLMTIRLQHAGADRGLLILPWEDTYRIEAEARARGDRVEVALSQATITESTCPEALLRYVMRTHERVLLDDASRPSWFSEAAYLRRGHVRAILCLPLLWQGRVAGALALRNTLTSHAFTAERMAVLELLAA